MRSCCSSRWPRNVAYLAFQHDWLWPLDGRQLAGYGSQGLFAWDPSGAGSFQVYPVPWWPALLASGFCAAFGAQAGLVSFFLFWIAIAALGIARTARIFHLNSFATAAASALYLGSPVLLNELQAGHIYFIIAYALLPWVYESARTRTGRRGSVVTGVLLGAASAQQQFFVMGGLLVIVATNLRTRGAFLRLGCSLLIAVIVVAPTWIDAAIGGVNTLYADVPLITWERFQSASVAEAARMLGYTAGYDARMLSPLVQSLLWAVPALAVLGAVLRRRDAKRLADAVHRARRSDSQFGIARARLGVLLFSLRPRSGRPGSFASSTMRAL